MENGHAHDTPCRKRRTDLPVEQIFRNGNKAVIEGGFESAHLVCQILPVVHKTERPPCARHRRCRHLHIRLERHQKTPLTVRIEQIHKEIPFRAAAGAAHAEIGFILYGLRIFRVRIRLKDGRTHNHFFFPALRACPSEYCRCAHEQSPFLTAGGTASAAAVVLFSL